MIANTKTYKLLLKYLLTLVVLLCLKSTKAQQAYTEYEIKAGYLVNFSKFVKWPSSSQNFSIGIVGQNPFGNVLEEMTKWSVGKGEKWTIEHYKTASEIQHCHVLFISKDQVSSLHNIYKQIGDKPILTVGDGLPNFCQFGGMINLTEGTSGRPFEINLKELKAKCLKIDVELLRLANTVESKKSPQGPCSTN